MIEAKRQKTIAAVSVALYPGRKQWFLPKAAQFFLKNPCRTLIEPFAGTGVIGFSLLHAGLIEQLVLVEKDERLVCMLKGLLSDPDLADRYLSFDCTRENVKTLFREEKSAFRYLIQSRCSNRGKFSGGLRSVIDSRLCRDMVTANIDRIYEMRDRVTVVDGDGFDVMRAHMRDESVGCFADPPYGADPTTSNGRTIYRHHKVNHPRLLGMLAGWRGPWVLTEDNCRVVRRLAQCHRLHIKPVRMNTSDNIIKKELMITRKRPLF
jgi:site-specific DNA-adenine methylase